MLRALGLRQNSLIYMISIQSLVFSIPGLLIALTISMIMNIIVGYGIHTFSLAEVSYALSWMPATLGVMLGLGMPFLSNIMPIKKALSKSIRDALDIFHNAVNDISV